jgi:hypothetical protein
MYALYGFLSRRRDTRRRFARVLSCAFTKFVHAIFVYMESFVGVATLGVGLSASRLVVFLGSSRQKIAFCVGVATPIAGALVMGSYVSLRM